MGCLCVTLWAGFKFRKRPCSELNLHYNTYELYSEFRWSVIKQFKLEIGIKLTKELYLLWLWISDGCDSDIEHTLNRKTLTSFVRTKPRGSVVITKPLALRMSLCALKASWLYYMDLYH